MDTRSRNGGNALNSSQRSLGPGLNGRVKMIHRGKNYKLQYDETLFEAEISSIFKDQVVIVLRERMKMDK